MAKICPLTNEKVLYLECNECDDKQLCRELNRNHDLISSILSDKKENSDCIIKENRDLPLSP